jgi:hypothetical protein
LTAVLAAARVKFEEHPFKLVLRDYKEPQSREEQRKLYVNSLQGCEEFCMSGEGRVFA